MAERALTVGDVVWVRSLGDSEKPWPSVLSDYKAEDGVWEVAYLKTEDWDRVSAAEGRIFPFRTHYYEMRQIAARLRAPKEWDSAVLEGCHAQLRAEGKEADGSTHRAAGWRYERELKAAVDLLGLGPPPDPKPELQLATSNRVTREPTAGKKNVKKAPPGARARLLNDDDLFVDQNPYEDEKPPVVKKKKRNKRKADADAAASFSGGQSHLGTPASSSSSSSSSSSLKRIKDEDGTTTTTITTGVPPTASAAEVIANAERALGGPAPKCDVVYSFVAAYNRARKAWGDDAWAQLPLGEKNDLITICQCDPANQAWRPPPKGIITPQVPRPPQRGAASSRAAPADHLI